VPAKEEGTQLPYEVGAEAERLEKIKVLNFRAWHVVGIGSDGR